MAMTSWWVLGPRRARSGRMGAPAFPGCCTPSPNVFAEIHPNGRASPILICLSTVSPSLPAMPCVPWLLPCAACRCASCRRMAWRLQTGGAGHRTLTACCGCRRREARTWCSTSAPACPGSLQRGASLLLRNVQALPYGAMRIAFPVCLEPGAPLQLAPRAARLHARLTAHARHCDVNCWVLPPGQDANRLQGPQPAV